ncbi:MAG: hypothetical protein QME06_07685 [Desulfobacterales bacterium]|nr:hypothetical protein [Desulfobacterales bacterium]
MQKNGSPQRRRVRGGKIFCLSGDNDKQKGLQPLWGKAAASGNSEAPVVWFVAAGLSGFVQSLSPDWTKIRLSLRSLRLCGEYHFSMKIDLYVSRFSILKIKQ